MFLTLRKILFKIVNQSIALSNSEARKARKSLSLSPIVGLKQTKTGVMILNKPEDNNNVTLQCADQLFRFLNTYHHDHTVESIWLENRGPSFSGGIDMNTLINDPTYLDKIFRLSIMMGEFNKPIFAKVNGGVRGLGAYMLTMVSTPLGTEKSSLRLDETSKGFIPIFGGSHRLSRLPANIGIYLALTGDRLDLDQMNRIGFLRGKVRDQHTRSQITKHLSDANLFMKNPYTPSSHSMSEARKENFILTKRNYFYELLREVQMETYKNTNNFVQNFSLNQYRLAQTEYNNTLKPFNSFSQNQAVANNYFEMRHDKAYDYLKSKGIIEDGRTHNNLIARLPIDKLMRVFNKNTMQQVMEQLKKDESQWARRTEQLIRNKDPLAVHLTFHLLKQTKQLNWVDCLEKQYTLARKILKISKLSNKDTPKGGSFLVLQNQYSNLQIQEIGNDIVQEFFKPASDQNQIFDHDTPKYSMMPTSDYWRQIPDAGRNYLNRTFFEDYHSKFADIETVRFLNANKIDYRDSSYNIPTLRQYLYKSMDYGRLLQAEKQRIRGILKSDSIYNKIREKRRVYLKKVLQKPEEVQKLVGEQIKLYFEEKFNHRFDDLKKTADIAGKESRMSIFRNYIKTLTSNIVYKGREIEDLHREDNARHVGIVRIDNQGRDIFTAQNQYEKQIPGYDKVKQAYFHRDPKLLESIDPEMPKPKNIGFSGQLLPEEQEFLRRDQALKRNYNDSTLIPRQMAINYRRMMQKASKTSDELAQLLGWQNSDIEAMIINSDKKDITLKQFSEQMIKNAPSIEEKVSQLNTMYDHHMKFKSHIIDNVINETKNREIVKNLFFDVSVIPRQFRQLHLNLLGQVIDFYSQKYRVGEGQINVNLKQMKKSLISKWAQESLQQSFSEFMKNDVEYTFSYLVVLHLKSILRQIQERNIRGIKKTIQFLKDQYGINFEGYPAQKFSAYFMNYLYKVLDMHEESKHRIILPETKMIQFIKQFKANKNLKKKNMVLNYQTLVFLIAKDRKMIRDFQNGVVPILGYHPEVNLNTIIAESDEVNNIQKIPRKLLFTEGEKSVMAAEGDFKTLNPTLKVEQLSSTRTNIESKKQLVFGFTHYLRRFQAMIQQIAGTSMFLPKTLYQLQVKKIYEEAKNLLKVQLSDEQWFKSKLRTAVRTILDFRFEKEKQMGQGQLRMFDRQFAHCLGTDCLQLLIEYSESTEEAIARSLVSEVKKEDGSNDDIKSNYLDIKQHIKNPRALRLFNNLILSQNIINERTLEGQNGQENIQYTINEQRSDVSGQRSRQIYSRTYQRLMSSAFQYPDEQQGVTEKNINHVRNTLGKTVKQSNKLFLPQIEQIMKLLNDKDLKEELEDRVRRIKLLENE